ncbi:uncharacterized protein [Channa argus]|uniref:uncharacterized protein isoform X3 n=1 Tax=Channa argus TaxID=215402 RepID=UPI003521C5C6
MSVFRWIQMSLFVIMLQFTVTGQFSSFTVRDGDDVTLHCGNVRDDQEKCDRTDWLFSDSGNTAAVRLNQYRNIQKNKRFKSDRLSVTENCSLVIKKVTDEDVGRYTCRQFDKSGQYLDSEVYVSVVTMTEHKDDDKVTLTCSVWTDGHCGHTVKWLYDHNKNEFTDTGTPQSSCSVTVTLTTSDLNQKYSDLLKCEVTDGFSRKVQQFTFRRPSSGGTSGRFTLYISVAVASAALVIIIITVVVIRWKKTKREKSKRNKTELDENVAEPSDGVYMNYIKKSKRTAWDRLRLNVLQVFTVIPPPSDQHVKIFS